MTKTMSAILVRVLSEELGRQKAWREQDISNGFENAYRNNVMKEIEDFMKENDIEINSSYVYDGYCEEKTDEQT